MRNFFKYTLLIFVTFISVGCPSDDDDCIKTITIPQFYIVNNQTYSYDTTMEVPCDFPEPTTASQIEPPLMENFSYEVLNFEYTPDTGNNTSKLKFEIKINNSNNFVVKGFPVLTIDFDGLEISGSYSNNASIPCNQIDANSSCILTYEKEDSLDLGVVNSVNLIAVNYYLIN